MTYARCALDATTEENGTMSKTRSDRGGLWQLHDALANEVIQKYRISIEGSKHSEAKRKLIGELTEFNDVSLKKKSTFQYEDYDEALSETIALIANGITSMSIAKN